MTPLAYRIVKQSWLPVKHREPFDDQARLFECMDDIHCFEVSEVFELADELGARWHAAATKGWTGTADGAFEAWRKTIDKTFAFLPAPKTWIEFRGGPGEPKGWRMGWLLQDVGEGLALCAIAQGVEGQYLASVKEFMVLALRGREDFTLKKNEKLEPLVPAGWQTTTLLRIYALLALINSPKIIGRRQHMPHRTLIKNFAGGKFPLHAWTEIKLQVAKPPEIDDGFLHEAHLTGRRALHFCRAHIRIRLGQLEYVSSHWRGDASIGIKQSRYVVTRAQNARPNPANLG